MINLMIDNKSIEVNDDVTILEAAKLLHIDIPTLCHHPLQEVKANCRICLVEIDGGKLVTACSTKVKNNMNVRTNTKFVREIQRGVLELILANHDQDCLKCTRNGNCELQNLCERFDISHNSLEDDIIEALPIDRSNNSIVRDYSKCIKCNRCVEVCSKVQSVSVLSRAYRSTSYEIMPRFNEKLGDTECVFCGQCINICPVGAIYEKSEIDKVLDALDNEDIHVIAEVAPAVRISLGEEFGFEAGTVTTGKIVSSLKRIGFNNVFDTNFTADLTIIEEGYELIDRITNNKTLPMITSCSPGWINYIETFEPSLLDHLSSCKSPQQMFGALSKTYYADKIGIHPSKIFTVSIMPCTAKKHEAKRSEMNSYGNIDVNAVLTTRELAKLIKKFGIDYKNIEDSEFDNPFGITTGAGAIFCATGGVMEAALRTVYEVVTGEALQNLDFHDVRGLEGFKEAKVKLGDKEIFVAVCHGLSNAKKMLEEIKDGKSKYTFIEVMACPGGCIGGGGQPISSDKDILSKRMKAVYRVDKEMQFRQSHKNPAIETLYNEFLEKPLGHKSHELLHTSYSHRIR